LLEPPGESARLLDAFVLSGLVEKLAKWTLLVTAVYHWRELDEPLDGLVYGVTLSLGFATLENVIYLGRLGLGVAWPRALAACPRSAGGLGTIHVGAASDPRFDQAWRTLADGEGELFYIEDDRGEGLLARVRRAPRVAPHPAPPPHATAARSGLVAEAPTPE